jgi:hypothetical protein
MQGSAAFKDSGSARHLHRWGFADTRLELDGPRSVRMTGTRYPLSGQSMPHLIPSVEQMLRLPLDVTAAIPESPPEVPPPRLDLTLMTALERLIPSDRLSTDAASRLAHSHGQLSIGEVDRLLYGGRFARVVDVVVEPVSEDEVRAIVGAAIEHDACLVPYGGGTNVSGALMCPEHESRTIVSIDMRRMRQVRSVDTANGCALVEAGIAGADLEEALAAVGHTCGHTPDSLEFSTLGGWIATSASGMKKNRYGNIEDIVIEATLVTPSGTVETRRPAARTSTGLQPMSLFFGSEGNLGVITKALITIHPFSGGLPLRFARLPQLRRRRGISQGARLLQPVRHCRRVVRNLGAVGPRGGALRRSRAGARRGVFRARCGRHAVPVLPGDADLSPRRVHLFHAGVLDSRPRRSRRGLSRDRAVPAAGHPRSWRIAVAPSRCR